MYIAKLNFNYCCIFCNHYVVACLFYYFRLQSLIYDIYFFHWLSKDSVTSFSKF